MYWQRRGTHWQVCHLGGGAEAGQEGGNFAAGRGEVRRFLKKSQTIAGKKRNMSRKKVLGEEGDSLDSVPLGGRGGSRAGGGGICSRRGKKSEFSLKNNGL